MKLVTMCIFFVALAIITMAAFRISVDVTDALGKFFLSYLSGSFATLVGLFLLDL